MCRNLNNVNPQKFGKNHVCVQNLSWIMRDLQEHIPHIKCDLTVHMWMLLWCLIIPELWWKMMRSPEWKELWSGTSQASIRNQKVWRNHTIQFWEKHFGATGSIQMVLGHSTWLNRWLVVSVLTFGLCNIFDMLLFRKECVTS